MMYFKARTRVEASVVGTKSLARLAWRPGLAAFLCCLALAGSARAEVTSVWQNNANGQPAGDCNNDGWWDWFYPNNDSWSQQETYGGWPCDTRYTAMIAPSNWSTACYPTNGNCGETYDVIITAAAPTNMDVPVTINSLTVLPGGLLNIFNATSLGIMTDSTLSNAGTIVVNPQTCCNETRLDINANVALQGGGSIDMRGMDARAWIKGPPGVVLTQAADHSIFGLGTISAGLANAGLVNASAGGSNALTLTGNPMSNTGTFRASTESYLDIKGITVDQKGLGLILADPGFVRLTGGTSILGGTLASANGGWLYNSGGNNTLTDVTLTDGSLLDVANNSALSLAGTRFTNNGLLRVNRDTCCSVAQLDVTSNLSLEGSGRIQMMGMNTRAWLTTEPGVTLTQTTTHTIDGLGQISASLVNAGLINANVSGSSLGLDQNDKINTGTFEATGGGLLDISGIGITQTGGGKLLADGGTIRLFGGVTVIDGELTDANGGVFQNVSGNNTLTDVRLNGGSEYQVFDTTVLSLTGSAFTNNGRVLVNPQTCCSETRVDVNYDLAFKGTGTMSLRGMDRRAVLQTAPGVKLTQEASHTIDGQGTVTATLENAGTIVANAGGWNWLHLYGGPKLNTGLFKADTESYLDVYGMTLTQIGGGRVVADPGVVYFSGGLLIDGGTLTSANNGLFVNRAGTNTFKNVHLSDGSTLNVDNNTVLTLIGSALINDGTVVVNDQNCCTRTPVEVASDLALQGHGTIRLNGQVSRAQLNTADGIRVLNTATHSIRGYGELTAALDNAGLIECDMPGQRMYLDTRDKTNSSTIRANGGDVEISAINLTQDPTGQLVTQGGNIFLTNGASVIGGSLGRVGSSGVFGASNATLTDVTLAPDAYFEVHNATTTTLAGTAIVNDGLIVINPETCCSFTQLLVDGNVSLTGTGRISMRGADARATLATTAGSKLIHTDGHTIEGMGQITAALDNAGVVNANWSGNVLRLHDQAKTNSGVMQSTSGGLLDIGATSITQTGTGRLLADGGGIRLTDGAIISGGTLVSVNGGWIENIGGTNTLQDVTIAAGSWLGIDNGTMLAVSGSGLINDGTLAINPQTCCAQTQLFFVAGETLGGSGEVQMAGENGRAQINVADGGVLAVAAGQRIHGRGQINGALANAGSIIADVSANTLTINAAGLGLLNSGTLGSANGGILIISGPATSSGAIFAGSGSTVDVQSGAIQTTGTTTVDGTLNVPGGGTYKLAGGIMTGAGTVNGSLLNSGGVVSPGHPLGTLTINGAYSQAAGGTLRIEIAGPGAGQMDTLAVSGPAALSGALEISTVHGFTPRPGQVFVILTGNDVTGAFSNVIVPAGFQLTYEQNRVLLTSTTTGTGFARPDFNHDYGVDQLDVQAFNDCFSGPTVPYAAGCEGKDLDGDHDVDQTDFALLQRCYSGSGMADATCGW